MRVISGRAHDEPKPAMSGAVDSIQKEVTVETFAVTIHRLELAADAAEEAQTRIGLAIWHQINIRQLRQQHGKVFPDQFSATVLEQHLTSVIAVAEHPPFVDGEHRRIFASAGDASGWGTAENTGEYGLVSRPLCRCRGFHSSLPCEVRGTWAVSKVVSDRRIPSR